MSPCNTCAMLLMYHVPLLFCLLLTSYISVHTSRSCTHSGLNHIYLSENPMHVGTSPRAPRCKTSPGICCCPCCLDWVPMVLMCRSLQVTTTLSAKPLKQQQT